MLIKKNHIINYFKEVKYISDQIGISKIEKLVKELVKIRKKKINYSGEHLTITCG